MSKRQVWLDEDQCRLITACLEFAQTELNGGLASDAHKMAGRYTYRNISNLLPLFAPKDPQ